MECAIIQRVWRQDKVFAMRKAETAIERPREIESMYVCMYACMHACVYVYIRVSIYVCGQGLAMYPSFSYVFAPSRGWSGLRNCGTIFASNCGAKSSHVSGSLFCYSTFSESKTEKHSLNAGSVDSIDFVDSAASKNCSKHWHWLIMLILYRPLWEGRKAVRKGKTCFKHWYCWSCFYVDFQVSDNVLKRLVLLIL